MRQAISIQCSGALRRVFTAEPLFWGVCIAATGVLTKLKSKAASLALNAPGLHLGPGCVVRGAKHIVFGQMIYANRNLWLEAVASYGGRRFRPSIEIGDNVSFSDGVHITATERIVIGRHVLMGSRILIADHNHGCYRGPGQSDPKDAPASRRLGGGGPVIIGENAWIGDNVVILGPVAVGRSAVIAANSVVRRDVPAETIVAGAPAAIIKRFNRTTHCWERT